MNSSVPEMTTAPYRQLKVEVGPCSCTCAGYDDQYGHCGKREWGCGYKITR